MKMHIRPVFVLLYLSFVFALVAKADIPPDPGYRRVYTDLVVTAQDDFPEYRFFFETMRGVEEISLKKGEVGTITYKGGGAAGSGGTLIAIPKASLKQYGEKLSSTDLDALKSAIGEMKITGIELLSHTFTHDVFRLESDPPAEAYQLKRTSSAGISAVRVSLPAAADGTGAGVTGITKTISSFGVATIVGGLLLSLAIIFLGLWAVLRSVRRKSKQA